MGISTELTGTPWHVERFARAEGDEKRHSHRCKYFRSENKYCKYYCEKCRGATHCDYYQERNQRVEPCEEEPVKDEPPVKASYLSVGDKVKHKTFGDGYVIKVDGDTVTIAFKDATKELSINACIRHQLLVIV